MESRERSLESKPPCWASVNGTITPFEEALIPLNNRGTLFGEAVFTTLLVRGAKPVFWQDHLNRLEHSRRRLNWDPEFPNFVEEWTQQLLLHCAEREPLSSKNLKIYQTIQGAQTLKSHGSGLLTILLCQRYDEVFNDSGLILEMKPEPRDSLRKQLKLPFYLDVYLKWQNRKAGSHEVLFFDESKKITETTTSNFFLVSPDLKTIYQSESCFEGISQRRLLEALQSLGGGTIHTKLEYNPKLQSMCGFTISCLSGPVPVRQVGRYSLRFDKTVSERVRNVWNAITLQNQKEFP